MIEPFKTLYHYVDIITTVISFLTLITVFKNWLNARKQQKPIAIILKSQEKTIEIPIKLMRKNVTRSEVFGTLGAFNKEHKFKVEYISSKDFFEQLLAVQEGKKDSLIILLEEHDDYNYFSK